MDKKTDSKNIVMRILTTDTKGHAASKADAASQQSWSILLPRGCKKGIKKHDSARIIADITKHTFVFSKKGFAVFQENQDVAGGKEEHLGQCYSHTSTVTYTGVESFETCSLLLGEGTLSRNVKRPTG